MFGSIKEHLADQVEQIRRDGLFKSERIITSPQRARVGVLEHEPVLNLCAITKQVLFRISSDKAC